MRVLVVQATRMGDTLQTSPLIRMIRLQHPTAEIDVMVRRMGRIIAERHPDVREVIVYDEDDLFLHLRAQDSDRLLKAFSMAEERISALRARQYDLAYNVTHSLASAMMLQLAGIPEVVGAHLTGDGQFVLRGSWTTYFYTSVFQREYSDLNLCDITRQFASEAPPHRGLLLEVTPEEDAFAANLLAKHSASEGFVACLQLGASEESKRWAAEQFAGLAQLLRNEFDAHIFLVGVAEEAPLGDRLLQAAPGIAIPLYGQTSIPQLAALLKRSNILVTNDTGTMHIAAAMNCPIALISVGNVHYRETGPYGAGHCAIEWRRTRLGTGSQVQSEVDERTAITPEHALQAVRAALHYREHGTLLRLSESSALAQVDVLTTAFAPDGCLEYYPLLRRALAARDFLRIAYRAMWLDHLNKGYGGTLERESWARLLPCYVLPQHEETAALRDTHAGAFAGLGEIAQRGAAQAERLIDALAEKKIDRAKSLVAELTRLDEAARIHGELHPETKPLTLLARYERDNLEGADALLLARETLQIYRGMFARARLMQRKLGALAEAIGNERAAAE